MSLLLNTPIAAPIQGYAVFGVTIDLVGSLVSVNYAPIVSGAVQASGMVTTPQITSAAFEALAGATNRLKALQAVANALALAGGTYTIT
jgi:hypothetical protein